MGTKAMQKAYDLRVDGIMMAQRQERHDLGSGDKYQDQACKQCQKLRDTISNLSRENKELKADATNHRSQSTNMQAKLKDLGSLLKSEKQKSQALLNRIAKHESEAHSAKLMTDSLELEKMSSRKYQSQIEELEIELQKKSKDCQELQGQIHSMQTDHVSEMESLRNEYSVLKEENERITQESQQKIDGLKQQVAVALQANSRERQQQLDEMKGQLDALHEECSNLRQQLRNQKHR